MVCCQNFTQENNQPWNWNRSFLFKEPGNQNKPCSFCWRGSPLWPQQPLLAVCWQILCKCCVLSHCRSWMPSNVLKIYLKLKIETKFFFCWQKCCSCFWDYVNSEQRLPSSEHLWISLSKTSAFSCERSWRLRLAESLVCQTLNAEREKAKSW